MNKDLEWVFDEEEINQEPVIEYHENGQRKTEKWYLNGKLHRENGPSIQWWYENGQRKTEKWYLNGKLHREDGPAYQEWFVNDKQSYKLWFLNGLIK